MSSKKTILWDFEGTLARRHGGWARVVAEILTEYQSDRPVTPEDVHSFFYGRWPWNAPDLPHPHITTPEAWWQDVEERVLITGYMKMEYPVAQAQYLAGLTRSRYIDAQRWTVYGDVIPTLAQLQEEDWEQVILSNHVPELPSIVNALGLGSYMAIVFTSALTGYEKPHPQAFLHALEHLDHPQTIWMIGDNIEIDILGAEKVGIPAILVRSQDERAARSCPDLLCLASLMTNIAPHDG